MRQMYCFACGGRWPVTCKCDRPDVCWQRHVAKLEADMAVLVGLLETARDYVGDVAQGRAHELAKAAIRTMAQDDLKRIDDALTRIQGEYRSGEDRDA